MAPKKGVKKEESKFVTVEQFSSLEKTIGSLADIVSELAKKPATIATPEAIKQEIEVKKAGPNNEPVNKFFKEKAEEILGDALERVEQQSLKSGGNMFHVLIKKEKSNATPEYWAMMKEDRRSRDIGNEGVAGVEAWCKLIRQNLQKPR